MRSDETCQSNLALVQRYYNAWSAGEVDAIAAVLDDDLVGHAGASEFSLADLLEFRTSLEDRFQELRIQTRETVAQDDRVAALWTTRAVTRDRQEVVAWHGVSMYRVTGKIAEIWDVRTPDADQLDSERSREQQTTTVTGNDDVL
jgi:ketosteroid isomerase-like protein